MRRRRDRDRRHHPRAFFANATAARGVPGCDDFWFCLVQSKANARYATYDLLIGVLQYWHTSAHVHFFLIHVSGCRLILCDRVRAMCPDGLNQRRRFGEYQTGVGTAKPKGIRYGGSSVGAEANAGADDG